MPSCPRCHQSVDAQAIACPTCRTVLKAHGHPGIPLYRANDGALLCDTCIYHADDTCNYPQRPYAQECTLYQSPQMQQAMQQSYRRSKPDFSLANWIKRNAGWLILIALFALIILNALRIP